MSLPKANRPYSCNAQEYPTIFSLVCIATMRNIVVVITTKWLPWVQGQTQNVGSKPSTTLHL